MAVCSGEKAFCSGPGTTVVRLEIPGTLLEQERKLGNLDKIQEKLQGTCFEVGLLELPTPCVWETQVQLHSIELKHAGHM